MAGSCLTPNCPLTDKMVTWQQYPNSANDRNRERGRIAAAARSGLSSILMLETMKIYIAGLLLGSACLVSSPAFCLEPCEATDDYVSGLNKIIDNAVGQQSQLALTVIPSFQPEYGVRMVGNDVYFVQLKTSFWYGSVVSDRPGHYHHDYASPHSQEVSVHKAALSPDLANRIKQRYADAISSAKSSDNMGLDGVTYRFALQTVGCGQTWTPAPETLDGQLVELADLLSAHAQLTWSFFMHRSEEKILQHVSHMK